MADAGLVASRVINLAHVAPFRLGQVEVFPATRQLVRGGQRETLEPRVMQVLVALAEAKGEVLTRGELVERCWGGRIVGENAINRVISRIRHVAADFGMASFQLETITKVGYRMVIAGAPPAPAPPPPLLLASGPRMDRRLWLGGAAALIAAAGAAWLSREKERGGSSSRLALDMYRRGLEARSQGWRELSEQAQAYFREAVEADPRFAEAWAALALAYAVQSRGEEGNLLLSLRARSRSAAERALALDSGLIDARAALILAGPFYRRWGSAEQGLRGLLREAPDTAFQQWNLHLSLGLVLAELGRNREALGHLRKAAALNPYHPGTSATYAWALWSAGRLAEAEAESERAIARWPKHPGVWFNRMALLTYSGRPAAALAFASDKAGHPIADADGVIARRMATARALDTRDPADVERAAAAHLKDLERSLRGVNAAVRLFAELGRIDTVFAICDAYYFNRGSLAGTQPPPKLDRVTEFLFLPPMAPARADPRFAALTQEIGLAHHWRGTGKLPDYQIHG